MKKPDSREAVAGETFRYKAYTFRSDDESIQTVLPRSSESIGRWCCISCGVVCRHNLDKDSHCRTVRRCKTQMVKELGEPAKHVLAWLNATEGTFEVP